ncbi:MAG TPA: extradiol ring-cleavage dioxygenase [Candidatus Bathyarchaeia archaeon]|nr:extradiol ring-cleavage dioxygenase [Candidatus Bathyarchaeia archaeon]
MGEILLVGTTHYPLLLYTDDAMTSQMERHWKSDRVPAWWQDQRNWPKAMQEEYGPDGQRGLVAAAEHRQRLVDGFRKVRAEIDAFEPDVVLIWGDDQYENFHEDLVPPFSIYLCEQYQTQPFLKRRVRLDGSEVFNVWGEPSDQTYSHAGHREAGKYLATRLLEQGYAMPYAYKTLHYQGLPHAFLNTLLYLDYDRKGFPYPVLPFHVNCYGSSVVKNRGGSPLQAAPDAEPDPPAPSARLCFDVGAATARVFKESRYRVVLLGSSSWSHAFLVEKHHLLWPDIEADRARYEELRDGQVHRWAELAMKDIEQAGQQEFLNWVCLGGALHELGYKPRIIDFIQTYIFNSSKCFMTARA